MRVDRRIDQQDLGDAGNLGAGLGGALGVGSGDQQMDVAADLGGGGYGIQRRGAQAVGIVFGNDQDAQVR